MPNKNKERIDLDHVKAALLDSHIDDDQLMAELECTKGTLRQKMASSGVLTLDDLIVISTLTGKPIDYFLLRA